MNRVWKNLTWLMVVMLLFAVSACGQKKPPPGSYLPGGSNFSIKDPTIVVVVVITSAPPPGSPGLAEKPVHFRNLGRLPYTVMPASYTLPDGSPGVPAAASTVVFPGGNPSSNLRLPLGTYTWCYQWELGDTNGDGLIDYAHAISPYPLTLTADTSDDVDLAPGVDLFAPAGSGEQAGPCATVEQPTARPTAQPTIAPPTAITPISSLPLEPITYQGDIGGVAMVMTIDFQSGSVTGTFSVAGVDYLNAEVSGGFLSANYLVTATYEGIAGTTWLGKEWATYGTLEGTVSDDYGYVSGILINAEGEPFDFTLIR